MSKRLNHLYRYVLPVLALMGVTRTYGQQNIPNTAQQSVSGSVTNTVPIPQGAYNGFSDPVQVLTQLAPKYRDTTTAQFTAASTADKAAMKTTLLSGQGNPLMVSSRRANGSFVIQPADNRGLPEAYSFQPYVSSNAYEFNTVYKSSQYHNNSKYPSEGGAEVSTAGLSASLVRNTSSSTERSSTAYAAGRSRIGQGRGTKTILIFNDANTGSGLPQAGIRTWGINSNGLPQTGGYYAANALKGSRITTAQGGEKLVLEDRTGKPVYEASLVSRSPLTYARTYYVYDALGRLRYVLPPKAVEALEAAGGTVSNTAIDELCFAYKYDAKGRQYAQHKPGEKGYTEVVYDNDGQVILRRNPIETSNGQWEVLFYDQSGRVMATAILSNNSQSRDTWQDLALNESNGNSTGTLNYYLWGAGKYAYPANGSISGLELMSQTFYDGYEPTHPLAAEAFNNSLIQPYLNSTTNSEPYTTANNTFGLVTATATRTIKATGAASSLQDWTYSKTFYDSERRPVYTVVQNPTGGKDTMAMQYNYLGQVLVTAHGHRYGNGSGPSFREWYRNTYNDQTGDISLSEHKVNTQPWRVMSGTTYDAIGRPASITLGTNAETQNYTYNIRGELTGINEVYALTGNNTGQAMSFGEALRYDYGYDSLRYDGLAAGMIWRASGGTNARAHSYGYVYDAAGRMTRGAYMRSSSSNAYTLATGWSNSTQDYSETVSYDQAGNITNLQRRAVVAANGTVYSTTIDNLAYTYLPGSNKLQKVVDASTSNYNKGDFLNGSAQGYTYDYAGNLTGDLSKDISSITYTWFNKPQNIVFSNGRKIFYSYDAGGNKVQEVVFNGNVTTTSNYIGTAIYSADTLKMISTPVGRTDMSKPVPQEQYLVKDHLGNVRSVVIDDVQSGMNNQAGTQTYNATYEPGQVQQEEQSFDNVASVSEDKPGSTSTTDNKAAMMEASNNTAIVGTTLMLKVMAGDQVNLFSDNYYEEEETTTSGSNNSTFEQMVSSLAAAAGQLDGAEGSMASAWTDQMMQSATLHQAYDALQNSATDPNKPRAYLNFLFFDERMELVPEYCHIWQADGADSWSRIGNDNTEFFKMPQSGYMAAYISNASAQATYFDNFTVTLKPGVLLEEKHYYPYGLPIVGMGSTASGMLPNKKRYQGNEYREDAGLNWMDFQNRQYDPQLGRFLSLDPLADAQGQQGFSPYHAMACNPSTMVDPLGLATYMMGQLMANPLPGPQGLMVEGNFVMFGGSMLEGGVSEMMKDVTQTMDEATHDKQVQELWAKIVATYGESNAQDNSVQTSNNSTDNDQSKSGTQKKETSNSNAGATWTLSFTGEASDVNNVGRTRQQGDGVLSVLDEKGNIIAQYEARSGPMDNGVIPNGKYRVGKEMKTGKMFNDEKGFHYKFPVTPLNEKGEIDKTFKRTDLRIHPIAGYRYADGKRVDRYGQTEGCIGIAEHNNNLSFYNLITTYLQNHSYIDLNVNIINNANINYQLGNKPTYKK